MRKSLWSLVIVMLVAGFAFYGCSQAPKEEPAEPAMEETAEPAAEAPAPAPAAPAPAAQEYTFAALCDKVVTETKAGNSYFTDDLAKQTKDGCMAAAQAYEASPKAQEAMAAFTKVVFDNCAGKSGQDWVMCYASQAEAAGKAASEAMMK